MDTRIRTLVAAAAFALAGAAHAQLVFSSDFETSSPASLNAGTATLTGVQGYAGLGQPGNQFGGQFLRSATANKVTLTLAGLPSHDALSVQFLFAAIDSLDGTGTFPAGDYFRIDIDGVTAFRESFANAVDSQIQSYVSPPASSSRARSTWALVARVAITATAPTTSAPTRVFSNLPTPVRA